ncbi:tetratricopeptide repeat protein [Silvimonas sp.]|uniref:tetratricopeptide repeat protein n=1 Tax=Silvimonas sp. TaxID=2650811 RepID=UPI00284522CA|nr:tetratricopeptide repeat protein [Silvimonas sp.]MDR3427661.1 tetratricopeptide repeat protein [Silvimonas sp.]
MGRPPAETAAVASAPAAAAAPDANADGPLPNMELSDELVMRFLVGDIALQRGQPGLAAQTWNDLARRTHDPRVAKRATEVAIGAGQLNLAMDSARQWIDASPNAVGPQQVMLSLLLRANRLDEAKPHLEALLKAKPQDVPSFFMQMHMLWDKNTDRKAAAKLTEEVTTPYLNLPEAHFARAVAYANIERVPDAIKEVDAAQAIRPGWEPAVLYRVQLMSDQPAQVRVDYLRSALQKNPDSLPIRNALARELVLNRQMKEALQMYNSVLQVQPDNLEALVGSGLVSLEQHDLQTAEIRLNAAVKKSPRTTNNLRIYLGQIAEERNSYDDAIAWYQSVEGDMRDAANQRLIRLYARTGKTDAALALVHENVALTTEQQTQQALLESQIYREAKNYDKAYAVLTAAIAKQPKNADLLYERSLIADLQHNVPGAEADLHKYLELQPGSAQGLNALGYTLANRTDRYDEANGYLEKAVALDPENPVILDSLGWLRYKQNRLAEARDLLTKAYKAMPDPEVGAHLAATLFKLGNKSDAHKVLAEAQKLDPDNESVIAIGQEIGKP